MDENTNKINVFPSKEQIDAANEYSSKLQQLEAEKLGTEVHTAGVTPPSGEIAAAEQMRINREKQLAERNERFAQEKALAEARRKELIAYGDQEAQALKRQEQEAKVVNSRPYNPPTIQSSQAYSTMPKENVPAPAGYMAPVIPTNVPYDVLPLPSEGKIYPLRKSGFNVAYLNASDENLLTSPNILQNDDWFDILLKRKILEPIDPKDLHIGDRNAILLWLRATSYGYIYPINVINPRTGQMVMDPLKPNEPYVHEVDLSTLKINKLGAEPDINGLFDYEFPMSKKKAKFRLLTVRDVDELTLIEDYELNVLNLEYSTTMTQRLERQIIEIDGNRDRTYIRNEVAILKAGDSRGFRKYVDQIESGVDLSIEIRIPGGESIKTFLPLNVNFFWPDFRL